MFYLVGMQYNINQQLWLLRLAEQDETGVTRTLAREYRYDGDGRVRYYERDRDPDDLAPIEGVEKWREFLGSSVYSDLDVIGSGDPLSSQKSRRYVHAADGQLVAWFDVPDSEHENGQWHFVHADMLGTTRLVTDDAGDVGSGLAYTAFGELAGSAFPGGSAATSRFGYCGGWGYEDDTLATLGGGSSDPVAGLGLLHVGARWYAPGLGRFVQRDPISIAGGNNFYSYSMNSPAVWVDPDGHFAIVPVVTVAIRVILIGIGVGSAIYALSQFGCWISESSTQPNWRTSQLEGDMDGDGFPDLDDPRAGGRTADQLDVICEGLEKGAKTPGTGRKGPGIGKPKIP